VNPWLKKAFDWASKKGWNPTMDAFFPDGEKPGADLTKPYAQSVWVHRAIAYIANPISTVPLIFKEDRRGGDLVIEDPVLTAFWEKPAVNRGGRLNRSDFVEATVGWLKLKGECFWIMDDTWLKRGGIKSPLILAKPQDMQPILGQDQEIVGWRYQDAGRGSHLLLPEQVQQLKMWNPYDDVRGLPEWEAAKIAADSDYAAGVFAKNLMANNGDRGPYVIGKDGQASPEQIQQITAMLRQKRDLSRRGDFRPVFLTGDIEVKEPGLQAVDAAYVSQRLENRHEIFLAFGVPPSFADVVASYSVGSASDRFKLIEETCMPLAAKIADAMEVVTARFTGSGKTIFVEFDFDDHSTMQQVRRERFESATKGVDRGMPWQVAGQYFRLDLPRFAGDEVGRIPFNLTPIEGKIPVDPVAEPATIDPVEELFQLFRNAPQAACKTPEPPVQTRAAEAWQKVHQRRAPWEKKFASRFRRHLNDARNRTLAKIGAASNPMGAAAKAGALDLIFDLAPWLAEFVPGMRDISRAAMEAAGLELWTDELLRDDALTMPAAQTLLALQQRENLLAGAGTKVWEEVRSELQAGIDNGDTMDELAKRIRSSFKSIDESRSMTIATTETTVAYEVGRDMTFKAAGVQWTQWLVSGLGNSRDSHQAADKQIREMGTPFDVGGFQLHFPGDPTAPPREVINCNCVRIAVAGPDGSDINNDPSVPY
jgi:HK97 family phage portal protein